MPSNHYTPTERRILAVLSDGEIHMREELMKCLPDPEFSTNTHLNDHLVVLRKKLRAMGQDIVCVSHKRRYAYRQMRHLHSIS